MSTAKKGLLERLKEGTVICAEGYVFELERRGYITAGPYVPEVVLEHPEVVKQLHRDLVRAGSDVIEALTYYAHREKLRNVGKEDKIELMNKTALRLAKEVAAEFPGTLVAGNICNSNIYQEHDLESHKVVMEMFQEQVKWAVEAGVDFIIGETIDYTGEALLALKAIKDAGQIAVINLSVHKKGNMRDGASVVEAAKRLKAAGADVVGLNCARGPETMLPILEELRKSISGPISALPVPYRTTPEQPTFFSLTDPKRGHVRAFPIGLDPFVCTRFEIEDFTRKAHALGINFLGLCCGAGPHHIRALSETLGRKPPACAHSPDMAKHFAYGNDPSVVRKFNQEAGEDL